ncbi:hypothetical protein CYLTODRAFT_415975, partial [Cylindrobasidium torrendii FP15055 ss-10]
PMFPGSRLPLAGESALGGFDDQDLADVKPWTKMGSSATTLVSAGTPAAIPRTASAKVAQAKASRTPVNKPSARKKKASPPGQTPTSPAIKRKDSFEDFNFGPYYDNLSANCAHASTPSIAGDSTSSDSDCLPAFLAKSTIRPPFLRRGTVQECIQLVLLRNMYKVIQRDRIYTLVYKRFSDKKGKIGSAAILFVGQFMDKIPHAKRKEVALWYTRTDGPALYSSPVPEGSPFPNDPAAYALLPKLRGLGESELFTKMWKKVILDILKTSSGPWGHELRGAFTMVCVALIRAFEAWTADGTFAMPQAFSRDNYANAFNMAAITAASMAGLASTPRLAPSQRHSFPIYIPSSSPAPDDED